jgi:hypothetical protein
VTYVTTAFSMRSPMGTFFKEVMIPPPSSLRDRVAISMARSDRTIRGIFSSTTGDLISPARLDMTFPGLPRARLPAPERAT